MTNISGPLIKIYNKYSSIVKGKVRKVSGYSQ